MNMGQEIVPTINYAKLAGDVKSQVVNLTAMLLDIPPEHGAHAPLTAARTSLEQAYAKLRESVVPQDSRVGRR